MKVGHVAGMNFDSHGLAERIASRPSSTPRAATPPQQIPRLLSCVYCGFRGAEATFVPDGPEKFCCADDQTCEGRIAQRIRLTPQERHAQRQRSTEQRDNQIGDPDDGTRRHGLHLVSSSTEPAENTREGFVLAPGVVLPHQALFARFLLIAKSGAGKTNGTVVMAEEIMRAGFPAWQLDPIGNLHGQRSSLDGQSPGFPVLIFGGRHGDLDIGDPESDATAVVRYKIPALFDLSDLSDEDMREYAEGFAPAVLRESERSGTMGHVFFHEADRFAPNAVGRSRVKIFARTAQNFPIGYTFATQRHQILSRDVASSANAIVLMRMSDAIAEDGINKRVRGFFDSNWAYKDMIASLPKLRKGEGYLLHDADWLDDDAESGEPMRFCFRFRSTFESSARRRMGVEPPVATSFADVSESKTIVETFRRESASSVPVHSVDVDLRSVQEDDEDERTVIDALRAKIAELEAELELHRSATVAAEPPTAQPARRGRVSLEVREPEDLRRRVVIELVRRLPEEFTTRAMLAVLCDSYITAVPFQQALESLEADDHIILQRGPGGGIALTSAALDTLGISLASARSGTGAREPRRAIQGSTR